MADRHQAPGCDGGNCQSSDPQELRALPIPDGNAIVCRPCFESEMAWRREHGADTLTWEAIPVYKSDIESVPIHPALFHPPSPPRPRNLTELIRALTPGVKLTLTSTITPGRVATRTVHQCTRHHLVNLTEKGEKSYLQWPRSKDLNITPEGWDVLEDGKLIISYRWV